MLQVELVYVTADGALVQLPLSLPAGACVADAINASSIYRTHPETQGLSIGIYAKRVTLDTVLKEGDRVELYRPLTRDPKEKRRQIARGKTRSGKIS